jgi:acetolactate synthase-1/2/3 large subunit
MEATRRPAFGILNSDHGLLQGGALTGRQHGFDEGRPGPTAAALLDLDRPVVDLVALAKGFGVPAVSVTTVAELDAALRRCLTEPGPSLIEAVLPAR